MTDKALPVWVVLLLMITGVALGSPEDPTTAGIDDAPEQLAIATVNGEPIYAEDFERTLAEMHEGQDQVTRTGADLDALMFRLVNDALLAAEARTLELDQERSTRQRADILRKKLAVQRLESEEIWSHVRVTDEQLHAAYETDYKAVTFRMVTAHEQEGAQQFLEKLNEGADFEALAKAESKDAYAGRGGLVKNVSMIDVPTEYRDELFGSTPGELYGPIRTRVGWAVLKVESFADADPEAFDRYKPEILDVEGYRQADALRKKLDKKLQQLHPAKIDQQAVDAIECEPLPDGRLMPKVDDEEAVLVTIGDGRITAKRYGDALKLRWRGVRNIEAAVAMKPLVLQGLVHDDRMLAEALRRGYDKVDAVNREVRALETQLLVRRYLSTVIGAGIEITEEEKREYYEEYKTSYQKPPKVRVGQITVETREQADEIAELLRQGTDLAWLARERSIDRFRAAGGDRGWMVPSQGADPIQDAISNGEPGDVLGPFGAPGNFIVMRLGAREDQGYYSFEELSATAERSVYEMKFEKALDEAIQVLRSRSEIVIDEEALAAVKISGAPAESEGAHSPGRVPH